AYETIKIFESAAPCGPGIERAQGTGLPHRNFMALAELRSGVTVELEGAGDRRNGVGHERTLARRRCRDLGDRAHSGRVVIAPGQQRLARGRAQGGGVEPRIPQAIGCQPLEVRCPARTAKDARRAKADVIEKDDENIWARPRAAANPGSADNW